jgi:pimeloyl-ACP methyl ester carboxylesterase
LELAFLRQRKILLLIQDVDTLVEYLKRRFEVDKIFLVGYSWGARLGLYSVQRHPENYIAYVGVGQELAAYEGELLSYQYTLDKAKEQNNVKAINDLEESGPPQSGGFK